MESDAHSFPDSVVFDRGVKAGLHGLGGGGGHHQLSILCHYLFVGNRHNAEFELLDEPLLSDGQMEFL